MHGITLSELAARFNVNRDRARYVLERCIGAKPMARVGNTRVFDAGIVDRFEAELTRIETLHRARGVSIDRHAGRVQS